MLDWLRYSVKLARLQLRHRKELVPLNEETERARKAAKSNKERSDAVHDLVFELNRQHDEKATLQSEYLCNLADKRLIPLPEMSEAAVLGEPELSSKWRRSQPYGGLILTDEAVRELRVTLRNDRRERLEIIRSWVATIVPGLTGLIGVIIGLLAIILGRR